jgi:hypothetical protein
MTVRWLEPEPAVAVAPGLATADGWGPSARPATEPVPSGAVAPRTRPRRPAQPVRSAAPAPASRIPAPADIGPAQGGPPQMPAQVDATTALTPGADDGPVRVALDAVRRPAEPASPTLAAVTPPSDGAPADEAVPHYRTRLPAATTLRYEMRRGILSGTGDLFWRPQNGHYELRFEARVSGLSVLTQVSSGAFDAHGVAPERFTDQRLRRSATAANFQRAAGKITFSGSGSEYPLRDGAQDRLTWMVQLAAIVAAEPRLAVPGGKVVMFVVGARGEGDVWSFRCIGPETVSTGEGSVAAIKFLREPREPHDTTVQVWLDPARSHLPVRALQQSGDDEPFDLRLREIAAPN